MEKTKKEDATPEKTFWELFKCAQAEFEPVELDGYNPHFKSRFATKASINRSTLPALHRHGFSVTHPKVVASDGDLVVNTTLVHPCGHQVISQYLITRSGKNDQQIGSSISYGERYNLSGLLNVIIEQEDDGEIAKTAASPKGPAKISEDKIETIQNLIGSDEEMRQRLFKWAGIKNIAEMKDSQFLGAVSALNKAKSEKNGQPNIQRMV